MNQKRIIIVNLNNNELNKKENIPNFKDLNLSSINDKNADINSTQLKSSENLNVEK